MNNVSLLGRLTRDIDLRYSQSSNPLAIANFTLAVDRKYKSEGQPTADFINCVAFGKTAEFMQQYMSNKGQQIALTGRIQVSTWDNEQGERQWKTEVVADSLYFADSKQTNNTNTSVDTENTAKDFFATGEPLNDENIPFK